MKITAINTNPRPLQKLQVQSRSEKKNTVKFEVAKEISFSWIVGRFFIAGVIILFTGIIVARLAG